MNEELSVTDKIYQQLHTVFVYGCKTCNSTRTIYQGYCNLCKEKLATYENLGPRDPPGMESPSPFPWIPCNLPIMNQFFGTDRHKVRGKANNVLQQPEADVYYLRICDALVFPKFEEPPTDEEGDKEKEPPLIDLDGENDPTGKSMDLGNSLNADNGSDNSSTSTITDGVVNPTDNAEDFK